MPVLDWPALKEQFCAHNARAANLKRWNRRLGMVAIVCAGFGLVLWEGEQLFDERFADDLLVPFAALLMTGGGLLGLLDWLVIPLRRRWLEHRFCAERLRQFYFQFLVHDLALAAAAVGDPAGQHALDNRREADLAELGRTLHQARTSMEKVFADHGNLHVWALARWRTPPVPAPTPSLERLLEALGEQRIDVQYDYSGRNLSYSIFSAPLRNQLLRTAEWLVLGAMLVSGAFALAAFLVGALPLGGGTRPWMVCVAIASAVGLTIRALREGLKVEEEKDRYESYAEGIAAVKERFDKGGVAEKVAALAELERLSYIELRCFLVDNNAARFLA